MQPMTNSCLRCVHLREVPSLSASILLPINKSLCPSSQHSDGFTQKKRNGFESSGKTQAAAIQRIDEHVGRGWEPCSRRRNASLNHQVVHMLQSEEDSLSCTFQLFLDYMLSVFNSSDWVVWLRGSRRIGSWPRDQENKSSGFTRVQTRQARATTESYYYE